MLIKKRLRSLLTILFIFINVNSYVGAQGLGVLMNCNNLISLNDRCSASESNPPSWLTPANCNQAMFEYKLVCSSPPPCQAITQDYMSCNENPEMMSTGICRAIMGSWYAEQCEKKFNLDQYLAGIRKQLAERRAAGIKRSMELEASCKAAVESFTSSGCENNLNSNYCLATKKLIQSTCTPQ